jgi:carboxymethylenebutenolidase
MTAKPATPTRRRIDFEFEGARIPIHIALPASPPRLTVMLLGGIWSVTPHIKDLCDRLAEAGFGAIAPCQFRNAGIPARDAPPELLRQAFLEFDDRRCTRDLRAIARAACLGRFDFAPGSLVACGFCLGGRFAHTLGALSEHVAGVVNFYGRLRFARQANKPFLPIELTHLIEVPYLGHFAERDTMIPTEDVDELRAALGERGVPHRITVHAGTVHGFVDPLRPTEHHPQAAAIAWAATLDFLHELSNP